MGKISKKQRLLRKRLKRFNKEFIKSHKNIRGTRIKKENRNGKPSEYPTRMFNSGLFYDVGDTITQYVVFIYGTYDKFRYRKIYENRVDNLETMIKQKGGVL